MEPTHTTGETEISIFDDARTEQEEQAKKVIKNARMSLFVIAGFQLIYSSVIAYTLEEGMTRTAEIIFGIVVASIFGGMGLLSNRKPYIALMIGLCIYIGLQLLGLYTNPENIAKGVFIKVLIISWLVKGITKAKHLESIKRDYNT